MLHYTIQGSGIPLVLIHGFPFNHTLWDELLPFLKGKYQVICPDLPGAGKSEAQNLSIEEMADEINALLEHEHIEKAIIAGHSMGGYISLAFAEKYPKKLLALGIIHSTAFADNKEKKLQRDKTIALIQNSEQGKKAFLHAMAPGMFSKEFAANHPEILQFVENSGNAMNAATLSNFQNAIKNRKDQQTLLANITFPIFWTIGDEDNAAPAKDTWMQISKCNMVDVHFYKSCGHCSMLEHPKTLATDLMKFLEIII